MEPKAYTTTSASLSIRHNSSSKIQPRISSFCFCVVNKNCGRILAVDASSLSIRILLANRCSKVFSMAPSVVKKVPGPLNAPRSRFRSPQTIAIVCVAVCKCWVTSFTNFLLLLHGRAILSSSLFICCGCKTRAIRYGGVGGGYAVFTCTGSTIVQVA